jgi:hypothetical protein
VSAERQALAECEDNREALALAWSWLGVIGIPTTADVLPALEWLSSNGVAVERSWAYKVRRQLAAGSLTGGGPGTRSGGGRRPASPRRNSHPVQPGRTPVRRPRPPARSTHSVAA